MARREGVRRGWRGLALGLLIVGLVAPACSSSHGAASSVTILGQHYSGKELQYGPSAHRGGSVTYQPDVVVLGGADSIKAAYADGLHWLIRGDAPHAHDLAVGKVMFATSIAVGRVAKITKQGSDLLVLATPVDLTDVVKDGIFQSTEPIPLDQTIAYSAPDLAGSTADLTNYAATAPASSTGSTTTTTVAAASPTTAAMGTTDPRVVLPPVALASSERGLDSPPPLPVPPLPKLPAVPTLPNVPKVPTDLPQLPTPDLGKIVSTAVQGLLGWNASAICCGQGFGFKATYDQGTASAAVSASLRLSSPRVIFKIDIGGGHLHSASLQLLGGAGVHISVQAAVEAIRDNVNHRIDIPVDFAIPIPLPGIPFNLMLNLTQTFQLSMAVTSKEHSIKAEGDYAFNGAIGFTYKDDEGWKPAAKFTPTVDESLTKTMNEPGIGIDGLVFQWRAKVSVGIGAYLLSGGVYGAVDIAAGLARSSDLVSGLAFPACQSATVNLFLDFGIGLHLAAIVVKVVNFFLNLFNAHPIKTDYDLPVFHLPLMLKTGFEPQLQVCKPPPATESPPSPAPS